MCYFQQLNNLSIIQAMQNRAHSKLTFLYNYKEKFQDKELRFIDFDRNYNKVIIEKFKG